MEITTMRLYENEERLVRIAKKIINENFENNLTYRDVRGLVRLILMITQMAEKRQTQKMTPEDIIADKMRGQIVEWPEYIFVFRGHNHGIQEYAIDFGTVDDM